jgi:tetratricopeptide (TPR) repeat protein
LARFDEAAAYGEKGLEIARLFPSDQYLYFKSLGGLGRLHWITGDFEKAREVGKLLLAYGERTANSRSNIFGHCTNSLWQSSFGDIPASARSAEKAIEAAEDPLYLQFGRLSLGIASSVSGDFAKAEEVLKPVVEFSEKQGCHVYLPWALIFLAPALIAQGRMSEGMKLLEQANEMIHEDNFRVCEPLYEYTLGKIFSLMTMGPKPSFSIMTKNIRFLAKNVPFASRKAMEHFSRAIEVSKSLGMNSVLCPAYMDVGLFHKWKKENEQAKECVEAAIEILEKSGPSPSLERAREALASLKG